MSKNFYRYEDFPEYEEKFTSQMKYKGYTRAIFSTMVDGNLAKLPEIYSEVGKLRLPVCLFWGENDTVVPYENNQKLRAAIPHVQFHSIEKSGHLSHYERSDLVNPLLLKFLYSDES